jgi:endonuclease G
VLLFVVARYVLPQCGAAGMPLPANSPPPLNSSGHAGSRAPTPSAGSGAGEPLRGSEAVIAGSVHVALGIPRDADASDDHYLDEQAYVLSYSPTKRVPNWVAWRLDQGYLGRIKRKDDFRADLSLPARFYRVNESDYLHSGYDRGHMCPSADREDSAADNSRTFLFTNMQPQLHELNAGPWERLEVYARQRAQRGQVLYIAAGGVFSAPFPTIGNGVAIPAANFKILVLLNEGQGARDVTAATEVLAVMMPNQKGVGEHAWTEYLTSVDAIEQASGYDFLNAVSEPVQRVIEARVAQP